jgi:hypothetical protein
MRQSKEIIVSGKKYVLTNFSTSKSFLLGGEVIKACGKSLATIASKNENAEVDVGLIISAVVDIFINSEPVKLLSLAKELITCAVYVDDSGRNRALEFDMDFCGEIGLLFKLLKEIIVFEWAPVFLELGAAVEAPAVPKAQRIKAR